MAGEPQDQAEFKELENLLSHIYSHIVKRIENGVETECFVSDLPPLTQIAILYDFIGHGKFSDAAIRHYCGDEALDALKQLDEKSSITGDVNLPSLKTYQPEIEEDQLDLPLTFPDEKKIPEIKAYRASKKNIAEISKLVTDTDTWKIFRNPHGKGVRFNVASRRSENKLYVSAILTADPNAPQPVTPLTAFDKRVENAVGNLFDEGYTVITARMIFFKMCGRQANDVSPKMLERIDRSMIKLEATWVRIDYTEQWKVYNKKPDDTDKHFIYSKVVAFDRIEAINKNGKLVEGAYILRKMPVFFGYSKEIGQVFTYPAIALDVPNMSSTENSIVLGGVLIEYLALMQRKGAGNVKLDTVLTKLDINSPTKDQRINIIGSIRKFIAHWKRIGLLREPPKGQADEVKDGNEITGFSLYPKKHRGKK